MNEAMMQMNGSAAVPRTRRGTKRLVFQPPRQVPRSVRSLWESASAEERTKAHMTCVALLAMWLGRKSRSQVASELSLPPLRVWQLSQSALSGMLAGLLKQPRGRGKGLTTMQSGEEDPRALRRRISELEAENRALKDLLEVLKSLPSVVERPAPAPRKKPVEKKRGKKTEVQRKREAGNGTAAPEEGEAPSR